MNLQFYFKKYQAFLWPVGAFLLIVFISTRLLIPKSQSMFDALTNLNSLKSELTNLTNKRKLLDSLNQNDLIRQLQVAQTSLPADKDAATILMTIENLSGISQLGIDAISLTPGLVASESAQTTEAIAGEARRNSALALPVSISAQGTNSQLAEFLTRMETVRRVIDLESVSVALSPDTLDSLKVQFNLFVYYLPPISQIGTISSPLTSLSDTDLQLLTRLNAFTNLSVFELGVEESGIATEQVGRANLFVN